jgi:hypothetical protein
MVLWMTCSCGKTIDEFELKCHWCGRELSEEEKKWDAAKKEEAKRSTERQLELF